MCESGLVPEHLNHCVLHAPMQAPALVLTQDAASDEVQLELGLKVHIQGYEANLCS